MRKSNWLSNVLAFFAVIAIFILFCAYIDANVKSSNYVVVEASTETSSFNMEYIESDTLNWAGSFYLYYDEETGVEYIAYKYDTGCSITPRLNADGSLYIHDS